MSIHKEGYIIILITVVFLILVNGLIYYFFQSNKIINIISYSVSALLLLMILQFFRSPVRTVIINENHIFAPADGKIVVIEEVEETEYFNEKRIQISIFMSPLNVHVNWYPISGIIKYFKYHPGKYLVAWHPKSSTENERTTVVIEQVNSSNDQTHSILIRQIAGAVARRIVYYCKEGENVKQGDELGFIKFGSRLDVLLPLDAEIKIKLNQHVTGNKTVIANFE